ncbi:MAG: cyclic nucleotide-binding domain-containing protein [Oscillospiraceae bacterium]|nr:cyclic nucleotide-binding domain-containing protein [Oscillospiraceae bacterium]MCL2279663.1 cyclic nucleotide-binding domain-containing protein [Oscillospiraceae bacterium]
MRKVVLIPTYWSRAKREWKEGDAVYDHPTPIDEDGTLERTLESMKILSVKDFKLVLLICPTTPEVADEAERRVVEMVRNVKLQAETYIFTISDLAKIAEIMYKEDDERKVEPLLNMAGYANVRNMCLLCADILSADAAILIDDDEVFEKADWVERSVEFLGKRIYGDVVYGMAGYYTNKYDQYYDDVKTEHWMTYWDRFGFKAKAFDEIIGSAPRVKRTPFAFGGAMIIHRDMFQSVPFDPEITRGEDIDYLINSRMYGFSFFLDNTLSIKHLPVPKKHPQWKRIREDIYRFVYEREKIASQVKKGNMVMVSPEDFDPYPGEFLREDLDEKIFRSNMMLATDYMMKGDTEGALESLNNIMIAKKDAKPDFDAFSRYRNTQKLWEVMCAIIAQKRYEMRKVMEEHNLTNNPILRNEQSVRQLGKEEIVDALHKAFDFELGDEGWNALADRFHVKTFYEDEMLFRSGDFNETMYIILKGELMLFAGTHSTGGEIEIARLNKGDILGESCIKNQPFTLNCRALQFTELIGIDRRDIYELIENRPELGVKFYQQVLVKVVGKMRSNNLYNMSRGGGTVQDAMHDATTTGE